MLLVSTSGLFYEKKINIDLQKRQKNYSELGTALNFFVYQVIIFYVATIQGAGDSMSMAGISN